MIDLENNNDRRFNFRASSSITIKNVPSIITLLELKEALSIFGEVSKASKRSVADGLDCCDIEFKVFLFLDNFNFSSSAISFHIWSRYRYSFSRT